MRSIKTRLINEDFTRVEEGELMEGNAGFGGGFALQEGMVRVKREAKRGRSRRARGRAKKQGMIHRRRTKNKRNKRHRRN